MENITEQNPEPLAQPIPELSFDERIKNILENGYKFEWEKYFAAGRIIMNQNIGGFVIFAILIILLSVVITFIPPVGKTLVSLLVEPMLEAGFFLVAYRIVEKKPYDAFNYYLGGFKFFLPLFLLSLFLKILHLITEVPSYLLTFGTDYTQSYIMSQFGFTKPPSKEAFTNLSQGHIWVTIFKFALLTVFWALFYMLFSFSYYIVVFGKKKPLEAMVLSARIILKKYFHFLLFNILVGLVMIAGVLALGVGLLYTFPLGICMSYAAYEGIVGTSDKDIVDATTPSLSSGASDNTLSTNNS